MGEPGGAEEAAERLRRHWDGVVRGAPAADGLDPTLAETVRRLHARDRTPGPSRAAVDRIWGELMNGAMTPTRPGDATRAVGMASNGRVPGIAPAAAADAGRRRWSPVAELATAAIVVLSVALTALVYRTIEREPNGRGVAGIGAPVATASGAVDVPGPEECLVAPRSRESALALIGDPAGRGPEEDVFAPITVLPIGTPADAETVAAVRATIREVQACENAGDVLRGLALHTDRHLRLVSYLPGGQSDFADVLATPVVPNPEEERSRMSRVRDVRVLPDGRVGAVVDGGGAAAWPGSGMPHFLVFARVGGRYLIDEEVTITLGATPDAATPTAAAGRTLERPGVTPSPTAVPGVAETTPTMGPRTGRPVYEVGATVVVVEPTTNLREAPDAASAIVAALPTGTRLRITGPFVDGEQQDWWPVTGAATGTNGYVREDFVAAEEDAPVIDDVAESAPTPTPDAINVDVTPTAGAAVAPIEGSSVVPQPPLAPTAAAPVTDERAGPPTVTPIVGLEGNDPPTVTPTSPLEGEAPTTSEVRAIATRAVEAEASVVAATIEAEATALRATVAALEREGGRVRATATALAAEADATSLDPTAVTASVQLDADGLLVAEAGAEAAALAALHEVLDRYGEAGCRVGFLLISGHGADVVEGVALARATELLMRREFPAVVAEAAAESLAVPGAEGRGRVDLQLFFYSGCAPTPAGPSPAEAATATAAPPILPSAPPAPVPTATPRTPLPAPTEPSAEG